MGQLIKVLNNTGIFAILPDDGDELQWDTTNKKSKLK